MDGTTWDFTQKLAIRRQRREAEEAASRNRERERARDILNEKIHDALGKSDFAVDIRDRQIILSSSGCKIRIPILDRSSEEQEYKVSVSVGGQEITVEFEKQDHYKGCECCDGWTEHSLKINDHIVQEI